MYIDMFNKVYQKNIFEIFSLDACIDGMNAEFIHKLISWLASSDELHGVIHHFLFFLSIVEVFFIT